MEKHDLQKPRFGWGRDSVELALAESGPDYSSVPNQDIPVQSGGKTSTKAADTLRVLAEVESQQDPTFQSSLCLYATNDKISPEGQTGWSGGIDITLRKWDGIDFESPGLPIAKSGQSKAKKVPETDAIFENIKAKDQLNQNTGIKRLSMDCKATVNLGEYSRRVKHAVRIRH
jgi:hypothetical protein